MAYDAKLAARVRAVLDLEPEVTERVMFGGLAFLVAGSMAVTANSKGALMVRVDPDDPAVADATPVVMGTRTMRGWVHVEAKALADDELATWVGRGVAAARSAG